MSSDNTSQWIRVETRLAIYLRDGLGCVYCGVDWSVFGLSLDHIVPRHEGGTNSPTNLVTSCHSCNREKEALKDNLEAMARSLGKSGSWLRRRIHEQAVKPSLHVRMRARELWRERPDWVLHLRELSKAEYTDPRRCPWCPTPCGACRTPIAAESIAAAAVEVR